jgi:hypothetical protein
VVRSETRRDQRSERSNQRAEIGELSRSAGVSPRGTSESVSVGAQENPEQQIPERDLERGLQKTDRHGSPSLCLTVKVIYV